MKRDRCPQTNGDRTHDADTRYASPSSVSGLAHLEVPETVANPDSWVERTQSARHEHFRISPKRDLSECPLLRSVFRGEAENICSP